MILQVFQLFNFSSPLPLIGRGDFFTTNIQIIFVILNNNILSMKRIDKSLNILLGISALIVVILAFLKISRIFRMTL